MKKQTLAITSPVVHPTKYQVSYQKYSRHSDEPKTIFSFARHTINPQHKLKLISGSANLDDDDWFSRVAHRWLEHFSSVDVDRGGGCARTQQCNAFLFYTICIIMCSVEHTDTKETNVWRRGKEQQLAATGTESSKQQE